MLQYSQIKYRVRHGTNVVCVSVLFMIVVQSFIPETASAGEYNSYEKRDPFYPLIGTKRSKGSDGAESVFTIENVIFQGVAFDDKGEKNAIINGELMKIGDKMNKVEIESIEEEYVSVNIDGKKYKLLLYER